MKWLIAVVIGLFLFNGLQRQLGKLGFGHLPGDFRFTLRGREYSIPLTSTLLLTILVWGLVHLL